MKGCKILIDCGEGTQNQLLRFGIRHTNIEYICISHLHGDHYFGLTGLISTMSLMGRQKELHIVGPPGLKEIVELQILHGGMKLNFELVFYPTQFDQEEVIISNDLFQIKTFPLKHRIHCTGFYIKETSEERHLLPEVLESYNVPLAKYKDIKAGADFLTESGELISNHKLTSDPRKPQTFAYCSDTIFDTDIVPYIRGVDMLYHEATYSKAQTDRATTYFHSTAGQAATIAQMAEAGKLIIGHFSSRYENLEPLLQEAMEIFENTDLAIEGKTFEISQKKIILPPVS